MASGKLSYAKATEPTAALYLAEGDSIFPELGKSVDAGALVGEIGVFATNARRMATIICSTDCRLYELTERQAKQLFFQDRKFGLAILRLVIERLLENHHRLAETPAK